MGKAILDMTMSLDGFIAGPTNDVGRANTAQQYIKAGLLENTASPRARTTR